MADVNLQDLEQALAEVANVSGSDQLLRVRTHRHKFIAHPIYKTRSEQKKAIGSLKVEDLQYLIDSAIHSLTIIQGAVARTSADYAGVQRAAREYVTNYYQRTRLL